MNDLAHNFLAQPGLGVVVAEDRPHTDPQTQGVVAVSPVDSPRP